MLIHANQSAVTESRTVVPGSGRVERAREDKGTQRDSRGWWTHSLPWLWRWFHGCEPMSKITKLCTLDTCNLSCVSYTLKVKVKLLSCVQLFATPWTVAYQAPPSMGFSRWEYWTGLPFPSPRDLPNPGTECVSPALTGRFFTTDSGCINLHFHQQCRTDKSRMFVLLASFP